MDKPPEFDMTLKPNPDNSEIYFGKIGLDNEYII